MIKIQVTDKERNFANTKPDAWQMVRNWFLDVEKFLQFEGFNPKGRMLPGSSYICEIEVGGLDRSSDYFNLVMNDLVDHFPDLSFEVL